MKYHDSPTSGAKIYHGAQCALHQLTAVSYSIHNGTLYAIAFGYGGADKALDLHLCVCLAVCETVRIGECDTMQRLPPFADTPRRSIENHLDLSITMSTVTDNGYRARGCIATLMGN